jgi:hypothetical protein
VQKGVDSAIQTTFPTNAPALTAGKKMRSRFQKFDALKSCAKVVMALTTLAGGLLLIRICGEQRLQRFFNMALLAIRYSKSILVQKSNSAAMVSNHVNLQNKG